MKYRPHDIVIHIRLHCDDGIETLEFRDAFDLIESALYHSDRRDIVYAADIMRLPSIIADAAKERIRNFRHERLRITTISSGSIILEGAVATAALYVLKKTLAEPLDAAYKKTNVYKELINLFRKIIDEKTIFIAEKIRNIARKRGYIADVQHEIKSSDSARHIFVELSRDEKIKRERIPTLGEELDEDENYTKTRR